MRPWVHEEVSKHSELTDITKSNHQPLAFAGGLQVISVAKCDLGQDDNQNTHTDGFTVGKESLFLT